MKKKQEWAWTKFRLRQKDEYLEILDELRPSWPCTLRQLFYQMIRKGLRKSTKSQYNDLSKLHTEIFYAEWEPRGALHDPHRPVEDRPGWTDFDEYAATYLDHIENPENYDRCPVQSQDIFLEVHCEKQALAGVINKIVMKDFCVQAIYTKGFDGTNSLEAYAERAKWNIAKGKRPVILFLSDHDPSGLWIHRSTQERLRDRFGLTKVVCKRIALTLEQVQEYDLVRSFQDVKWTDRGITDRRRKGDSRAPAYIEMMKEKGYGDGRVCWQLEALHPSILQRVVKEAIRDEFYMPLFEEEKEMEAYEKENKNQKLIEIYKRRLAVLEAESTSFE